MSEHKASIRLPAEWEPHAGVWIAWPCREEIWLAGFAEAEAAFASLVKLLAQYETVNVLVQPERFDDALEQINSEQVNLWPAPMDDSWSRDTLPSFALKGGHLHLVNWKFNAWGEKFSPYAQDAALGDWLAPKLARLHDHLSLSEPEWVLEGGSIHSDGEGTLLTTEECLLNPNRNGPTDKAAVDALFKQELNIRKVIWLPYGLANDADTDGHVDNVACFAGPGQVLLHTTDDPADPNFERSQANLRALSEATDAKGRKIDIVEMPLPSPMQISGRVLAPSYLNFYIANGAVIMPKFGDATRDKAAAELIKSAFPGRALHQLDARAIVAGGGGIHCVTMQEPKQEPVQ